jgi:hypothetical protein
MSYDQTEIREWQKKFAEQVEDPKLRQGVFQYATEQEFGDEQVHHVAARVVIREYTQTQIKLCLEVQQIVNAVVVVLTWLWRDLSLRFEYYSTEGQAVYSRLHEVEQFQNAMVNVILEEMTGPVCMAVITLVRAGIYFGHHAVDKELYRTFLELFPEERGVMNKRILEAARAKADRRRDQKEKERRRAERERQYTKRER